MSNSVAVVHSFFNNLVLGDNQTFGFYSDYKASNP